MQHLRQGLCDARTTGPAIRPALLSLWLLAALALSACGGSSAHPAESPAPPITGTPPSPPAQSKGTVVISVATTDGTPVRDLSLAINGGFDGRGGTTDVNGEARFTEVPVGDASVNTWGGGYHSAGRRFTIVGDTVTTVPIVVESVTEAIPVLLAARTIPSSDGSTMSLELDVAVLDEHGTARETLTTADFSFDGNCGWDWCLINSDGTLLNLGYSARIETADLIPISTGSRVNRATAILLDQSRDMAEFDPAGLRVSGLEPFLGSITSPDRVALASYYDAGVAGDVVAPKVTTYGPFTSDAADLIARADSLLGQETGRSTTAATNSAVAQLVQFSSSQTTGDPGGTQRNVVIVNTQPDAGYACHTRCADAVQAARDAGIPIVAIGKEYSFAFELATHTGGVGIEVVAPEQLPPVFRGLDSIISRSVAYNRVRLGLESTPGALQPGRLVSGYLNIRIGPNTVLVPWITVPIDRT